jgi:UDP-N-acetylglucosamine acyltransferase
VQEAIAQLDQLTDNLHVKHLQKFIQFSLADNRRGLIGGK